MISIRRTALVMARALVMPRGLVTPAALVMLPALALGCGNASPQSSQADPAPAGHDEGPPPTVAIVQVGRTQEPTRPPMVASEIPLSGTETQQDWEILLQRIQWARDQGLSSVPIGEAVARIGETFVGEPYTPGTLEVAEPEALVVNLREFDCVTFVETALALARVVQGTAPEVTDSEALKARYIEELTGLRYRHGVIDGYASRLHYFSEWIADNQARGTVGSIGHLLGGTEVIQRIDFMTTHAEAYRQLGDASNVALIQEVEMRLSAVSLYPVRQNRVGQFVDDIESGDIIAATSTVDGLDVAHTGIALWKSGVLHLMHAPLVGSDVQISDEPLAERLLRINGQDGILIARPSLVQ